MPPLLPQILGYALGAAFFAAGLWHLWGARNPSEEPPRTKLAQWRDNLTYPTRTAIGLALMFLGYHAAAWVSPIQDRLLSVPRERWWIAVAGATIAIFASLWIDRSDRS